MEGQPETLEKQGSLKEIVSAQSKGIVQEPASFFKLLSPMEFKIIKTLYRSPHGLTVKTIQGVMAAGLISEAPLELLQITLMAYKIIDLKKVLEIADEESQRRVMLLKADHIPIEAKIEIAREMGHVPNHDTIKKVLAGLEKNGYVGNRTTTEGRGSTKLYFITPWLFSTAKQSGLFD